MHICSCISSANDGGCCVMGIWQQLNLFPRVGPMPIPSSGIECSVKYVRLGPMLPFGQKPSVGCPRWIGFRDMDVNQ